MTDSRIRLALLLGLVTVAGAAAACDGETPGEGEGEVEQTCASNSRVCDNDRLCGGGFCDFEGDGDGRSKADGDTLGCCVRLVCVSDNDCAETEKCDVRRGICVPEGLCDPSQLGGGTCVIDGQERSCCGATQLCSYSNGAPVCLDAPPPAASCFIAVGGRRVAAAVGDPDAYPAVARAGEPLQLEAFAADAQGRKIPHATFTWSGPGVDGESGTYTGTCITGVCTETITATSGGASCTGAISVYGAPAPGTSRIVVIDLATGQPLANVDAAANIAGTPVLETTDASGAAVFDGTATNISAFPAGYQWHTVVDPPSDVIIYTTKIPDADIVGGVKGRFNFGSVSTTGDIKLGLAGTAIAPSITDLNFATLVGEIADYNVELEGLTEPGGQILPLPSGLVIGLGDTSVKGEYVAFGKPGNNIAWAIGGQLALAKVGPIISSVTAADNVNVGNILGAVLPFFATFDHGIVSGLDLEEGPRPAEPADGQPVPYASWGFDEVELTPNTLLAQSVLYEMPDLPCAPGAVAAGSCQLPPGSTLPSPYATGAVLLSGVVVPGVGIVPLGITAGLDDPDDSDGNDQVDGKLEAKGDNAPRPGSVIIDYAPPHDGLEGSLFVSVAIALDLNALENTDSGAFGASIVTHVTRGFSPTTNSFKQQFLQSQAGSFAPGATGSFQHERVGPAADFYRVNFDDEEGAEWNVWFATPDASITPDELHPNPSAVATRLKNADIQAFKLGTGYEDIDGTVAPGSFEDLFGFDGANLDNLLYYLGAWSSEGCKAGGSCDKS